MFKVPEEYRIAAGVLASDESYGNNGAFLVPFESYELQILASDGAGWEHVSVSLPTHCPSWKQMCFVKDLFWGKEDCVVQYHPPQSEYVNNHDNCLHLWRPVDHELPTPPSILVGLK